MRLSFPFASVPAAVPRPLRERDLGNGKGDIKKKIAKNLFISERTLYNHIQNIYDKLEVSNTVEAYNKAIKLGYIEPLM